jgi:ariadne-1
VTRGYFDSLVRDLETGLKSVDGKAAAEAGTSKSSRSKNKGGKGKGGSSSSRARSSMLDEVAYWSCERCTYANANTASACQMCATPRPA